MENNYNRVLNEFIELVKIDSESGNEREIATILKRKLTDLGFFVLEDNSNLPTDYNSCNLVATLKGNAKDATAVLFTCHMDTVKPGQKVKPQVKDGYVVSDGTTILGADDKAGIASLLEALRIFKESKRPHCDIQVVFTVGEEVGLVGAKALDPKLLTAKFCYALDSGSQVGNVIVAAPTQAKITAKVYGKTAHASTPNKGVSAIEIASRAISRMPLGQIDDETTANIGLINGGTATNIVCDYVLVEAEARSLNRKKLENQTKAMKKAFEETALNFGGSVDVEIKHMHESFEFTKEDEIVKVAMEAAHKLDLPCQLIKTGGGSDANVFNANGLPSVVLAAGYEDIHTKEEKMPIFELSNLANMVIEIIEICSARKS